MTAAAKVRVAKKAAAKKPVELPVLEFEAVLRKTTPGAFNMKEDNPLGTEPVSGGIYVRKAHLDGVTPVRIRVTVEVIEAE